MMPMQFLRKVVFIMVYINDSMIIINNKFENKIFVYDRYNRVEYNINSEMFDILEKIKKYKFSTDDLINLYGIDLITQLFELQILTKKKQKNINNVKRLSKYNNVRIFVELTNKCNLKCKHCYGGFACSNNKFISIAKLKELIDNASHYGVYQFDITGGEPTLYPDLEELLEYVYNSGMMVRIFTNLTLFSTKLKNMILKYGVKDIVTSLDSCIKEDHDEFRGQKGTFDKTVNAIKELQKEKIDISLNTMIGNHNINHIPELVDFISSLNVKSVMDVIVPEGRATILNEDIRKSSRIIKYIYDSNIDKLDKNSTSIGCGVCNRFIYVKSDGNIYLCPSLIYNEYKLGNIDSYDTEKIWKYMISTFKHIKCNEKSERCKKCTGGCRARALKVNDDICAKDDVYCILNGVEK